MGHPSVVGKLDPGQTRPPPPRERIWPNDNGFESGHGFSWAVTDATREGFSPWGDYNSRMRSVQRRASGVSA